MPRSSSRSTISQEHRLQSGTRRGARGPGRSACTPGRVSSSSFCEDRDQAGVGRVEVEVATSALLSRFRLLEEEQHADNPPRTRYDVCRWTRPTMVIWSTPWLWSFRIAIASLAHDKNQTRELGRAPQAQRAAGAGRPPPGAPGGASHRPGGGGPVPAATASSQAGHDGVTDAQSPSRRTPGVYQPDPFPGGRP